MARSGVEHVLERIYTADLPNRADLEWMLRLDDPQEQQALFDFADRVRREFVGNGILLRGIIEFANVCRNMCAYCGLNRHNRRLQRYRLTNGEILAAAENVCRAGIRTIVLQSGEDDHLDPDWLARVIETLKSRFDVAVTLSVGEHRRAEYRLWKEAGADRYLLKIETTDLALYRRLHPGMSFENRIRCLENLAELGYQTGSGDLIGLPGQTIESLTGDILFFKKGNFDMLSVSPFIPHADTALANVPAGDLTLTLKMIALTRIVSRDAHMPASTAIGSLRGCDERPKALAAGANVVMPNFTPTHVRSLYEIYPGKIGAASTPEQSVASIERMAVGMRRPVDYSRGDSLKTKARADLAQTQTNS
jgi:biotin synthase